MITWDLPFVFLVMKVRCPFLDICHIGERRSYHRDLSSFCLITGLRIRLTRAITTDTRPLEFHGTSQSRLHWVKACWCGLIPFPARAALKHKNRIVCTLSCCQSLESCGGSRRTKQRLERSSDNQNTADVIWIPKKFHLMQTFDPLLQAPGDVFSTEE